MNGHAVITHYQTDGSITERTYPGPDISSYIQWLASFDRNGWEHTVEPAGPYTGHGLIDVLAKGRETIIATFHQDA
jgi:hypothetical protein